MIAIRWTVAARCALCVVMVAAGIGKMLGEHGLVLELAFHAESGAGRWLAATIERAIPPLEVLTGLGLMRHDLVTPACRVGTVLSVGFLVVAWALPQGIECACFGVLGGFSSRTAHMATAGALVVAFQFVARVDRLDTVNDE